MSKAVTESQSGRFTREDTLLAVLERSNYNKTIWGKLKRRPSTNDEIRSTLTNLFGPAGVSDSSHGICHLRGGKDPAAWFGSYDVRRPADLSGDDLVAKIREVLQIPEDFEPEGEELDLVPGDPHGRDWSSLSDVELEEWNMKFALRKNPDPEDLERQEFVIAEIQRRDKREETQEAALSQAPLFDYGALDAGTADEVRSHTREIRFRLQQAQNDIIEIGKRLMLVKHRMPGRFLEWLAAEFEMSERSARNFMAVAEQFPDGLPVGVPAKALYLLASPSTPKEARSEAVTRARVGETITHEKAREIVERKKTERKAREPKQVALVEPDRSHADRSHADRSHAAPQETTENITETITETSPEIEQPATVADSKPDPVAADQPVADKLVEPEISPEAEDAWNKSTVVVQLRYLPHDGHKDGRKVIITAGIADQSAPLIAVIREGEFFEMDKLFEMKTQLKSELPDRMKAVAEGKKKADEAAKAAKKSAPKKSAPKKTSAKKPTAKQGSPDSATNKPAKKGATK